jgi:hypothetical protein
VLAIAFKVLVALATAGCGAWVLHWRGLNQLSERRFVAVILGLQLIPALGFFVALYVLGNQQVTSDVPAYYIPASAAVLHGKVPFLDFSFSYAPLFPYVGALLLFLWNSGKAFALFAIVVNAAGLLLWHAAARACFAEHTARAASVLYAASGQVLVQALLGTNQAWIATALAGSSLLLIREYSLRAGVVQAVAACTVKFLVLLFWPVLWICAPQRLKWLSGALLLSAAVYGAFALRGADLLYPLRHEAGLISSGNVPYLLEPLFGLDGVLVYRLSDVLGLLALGAFVGWLYLRSRQTTRAERVTLLLPALALMQVIFMLVSKKSFPGYILFAMYPLMLVTVVAVPGNLRRVLFFWVFNTLLALESSLCFYLGGDNKPLSGWVRERGFDLPLEAFLAVDIILIACYAYLAWVAVECLRRTQLAPAEALLI